MTIEDLKWRGSREYREEPTGSYTTNRNGRRVPVTKGTESVRTVGAGTMPLAEWYLRMETALKKEGKEDLLEEVIDHCRHLAWLKSDRDVKEYALECISTEAYKAWRKKDEEANRVMDA